MRKLFFVPILIIMAILITSCEDSTTEPTPTPTTGNLAVASNPNGAQIWIDG